MANIGSFKKSGNEFQGEIVTLSVQARGVRIVPEANRTNDNAPSHRVYIGRVEVGAAWSKRSTEGRDYLSVKLDDPSFNAPIYANLFDDEDGEGLHPNLVARAQDQRRLSKPPPKPRPRHRAGFSFACCLAAPFTPSTSHDFAKPQKYPKNIFCALGVHSPRIFCFRDFDGVSRATFVRLD